MTSILAVLIGIAICAVLYVGYLIGCHRYPSSSPKFKVEPDVVRDALKALRTMQDKRSDLERERLLAAFGYPKDWT